MDCSPPGSAVGFSRQGYWSESPCPPPGDLPDPGIEPGSNRHLLRLLRWLAGFFSTCEALPLAFGIVQTPPSECMSRLSTPTSSSSATSALLTLHALATRSSRRCPKHSPGLVLCMFASLWVGLPSTSWLISTFPLRFGRLSLYFQGSFFYAD